MKNTRLILRIFAVILTVILLFNRCATTRMIQIDDDSNRIAEKLTKKDLHKHVTVSIKTGGIKNGILTSFNEQVIVIFDSESEKKLDIPYDVIEKIEIKENKYWPLVLLGVVGVFIILYGIFDAIGEGIAGAGV